MTHSRTIWYITQKRIGSDLSLVSLSLFQGDFPSKHLYLDFCKNCFVIASIVIQGLYYFFNLMELYVHDFMPCTAVTRSDNHMSMNRGTGAPIKVSSECKSYRLFVTLFYIESYDFPCLAKCASITVHIRVTTRLTRAATQMFGNTLLHWPLCCKDNLRLSKLH